MPDMVNVQVTQAHSYLAELVEQFSRIEKQIEAGETVTLNLTDGGRAVSLLVSREKVVENDSPGTQSARGQSKSLTDNNSLVAALTKTFAFDIGEANRKISSSDIQSRVKTAAMQKTMVATESSVLKMPNPVVTHDGRDWILAEDCCYAALDGCVITAKRGFRSDLASIPRLFWAIIASFELSLLAPIMHDLIYRSGGRVILPHGEVTPTGRIFERKEADDLFLELMTRAKVSYWKRNVAYLAVRGFGQSSWQER